MAIARRCDRCGSYYNEYNAKQNSEKINGINLLNIDSNNSYFTHGPYDFILITFGHVELFTPEMQAEYIKWCQTEEGKRYLVGGDLYHA